MPGVRLILALHDHQPVGNFDGVFESAYREAYLPFLDVMADYPGLPFVLHTSGPLLEWFIENRPEYVARVRAMALAGRVEILGGAFFEPILTMIPHRDRVGQVRDYADFLEETFGVRPRGAWPAERVWEQQVAAALVEAGAEYTVLDDFHFRRAGVAEGDLRGYFLTEEGGRLLKVFPIAERLRYLIPFEEPHATYEYLRRVADERPGSVLVFADDGEKLGNWPETHQHVYGNGWLRRFCDMIAGNLDWIEPTTFAGALDATLPVGKVYLPDSSYREMTEWSLPTAQLVEYQAAVRQAEGASAFDRLRPFVRAGGTWRNFQAKYSESDEMYARMLGVSNRLDDLAHAGEADPDLLDVARQELYRGQCNCPYWHGAFGGLYLPHLRNAIYRHLIRAHGALDEAQGLVGPRASIEAGDFNLDARQEVRLENDRLIAFVRPAHGGHVYELDVREAATNLLATLDRRPEAYHGVIRAAVGEGNGEGISDGGPRILNTVVLKHEGLGRLLTYDRHPRKALVDHFFRADATLDDFRGGRDIEQGDFATGTYLARLQRGLNGVALVMERPGVAEGHSIQVRKSISLDAGDGTLDVRYAIEGLPVDVALTFAVEINLAGMAGHAENRTYADPSGSRLGLLDATIDLDESSGIDLSDEWLDLGVGLRWSKPAGLWCVPVETVSQSEGGFEAVYQSSAVVPRWRVEADEAGRWEVRIRWSIGPARLVNAGSGANGQEEWLEIP